MSTIKLALFGLMPDTGARLKIIIEKKLSVPVSWGNAVDSDVKGVIVNAEFLNSKNIQRYINHSEANIVCSYSDGFGHDLSNKYNITGLNVNDYSEQQCSSFISELTKTNLKTDTLPNNNKNSSSESDEVSSQKISNLNYKHFIESIKQPKKLIHAIADDKETWIDTRNKKVYFNYDRNNVPGFKGLLWKEVDSLSYPDEANKESLDVWLFESLYVTDFGDDLKEISHDNSYNITRWIHPLNSLHRAEIIRLAAFSQKDPISLAQMVEKTGYIEHKVKQFFFSYLLIGWLTITLNQQSDNIDSEQIESEENTKVLGMLGRLRKKFFNK